MEGHSCSGVTDMETPMLEEMYDSDYYDDEMEDEEYKQAVAELEIIRKRVEKQEQQLKVDRLTAIQKQQPPLRLTMSSAPLTHEPTIGGLSVATGYVYVAELGKLVPTVASISAGNKLVDAMGHSKAGCGEVTASTVHFMSDSDASSDSDCPVSPSPGRSRVWKRDSHGQKYCIERDAHNSSLEVVTT